MTYETILGRLANDGRLPLLGVLSNRGFLANLGRYTPPSVVDYYLLKEDGDKLLLESGDFILLES